MTSTFTEPLVLVELHCCHRIRTAHMLKVGQFFTFSMENNQCIRSDSKC